MLRVRHRITLHILSQYLRNYQSGGVGVVLFWMLSGALLQQKCSHEFSTISFYKSREVKIWLPQLLSYFVFFFICASLTPTNYQNLPLIGILSSMFGLEYWADQILYKYGMHTVWLVGEWFTGTILFIYLIFPILRWAYRKYYTLSTILITLIFCVNLKLKFASSNGGWFSVTNGIFCFWIGMMIARYKKLFTYHISVLLASISCIILLILNPSNFWGIDQLPTICFSFALFIFLFYFDNSNCLFDYISRYSFEIYLIHHRIFYLLIPLLLRSEHNLLAQNIIMLFVFAIVLMFAEKLATLVSSVKELINYLHNNLPKKS